VKFYLDEDLSPTLAEALQQKGIDAVSAHEAGNIQLSDSEQLVYASREGRCLVTRNARHFLILAREAIQRQAPHAGILLISPRFTGAEIGILAGRLTRIVKQYPKGLGPYDVFYL
jgi:predicted nuclease of predicted toxin-antitoxin system